MSVVIPTLNEEEHIESLLKYMMGKLHSNDELLVIDAQSSDSTVDKIKQLGVRVISCTTRCRAIQMNLGASETSGDVLYFVHADARPPVTFREDILKAIVDGFPMGGYRFKFRSNKTMLKLNSWFTRFEYMIFRGGDQTMFFKRNVFEVLNGFDESYSIMEEYDLLRRAKKMDLPFRVIPKDVEVSDRKYDENSYLKVNYANLVAMRMFNKGTKPDEIKRKYHSLLNHPKSEYTTE